MTYSLAEAIKKVMDKKKQFTLEEAYAAAPDRPKHSIRARIYDNIGIKFERVKRGIFKTIDDNCILVEGNGRDLSFLPNNSVNCIMTDHPWEDIKSNRGGDRHFTNSYECFKYTLEDFKEKARILKDGCFLIENIPAENENNYEYLFAIKQMAKEAGLQYYAKVSWKKGTFVSNTGRKTKNTEDIMIFSKGKPRALRLDAKKTAKEGTPQYMSGTKGMLPTIFDIQPVNKNNKIHQAEKPSELWEQILEYVTLEGEVVLDQFAGSGSVGEACIKKNRICILIELLKENIEKIKNRLKMTSCISVNGSI